MAQGMQAQPAAFRYRWQETIAGSGLHEILSLAQQLKESGLFDENQLANLRNDLRQLAVHLARTLVTQLAEEPPEAAAVARERERASKQFNEVRQRLHKVGESLGKIG